MTRTETQEKVNSLFGKCIEECEQAGIPIGNFERDIVLNARAKRRWGACKKVGSTGILKGKQPIFRIELSLHLAEQGSDFDICNTLVHELIHTCKGCQNHGKLWNYHASRMNSIYGYHVKTTSSGDEMESELLHKENQVQKYNYVATCTGCGLQIYRMKKSKFIEHPEYYKCTKCGGKFTVSEVADIK